MPSESTDRGPVIGSASAYYAFLTGYYRLSGGPPDAREVSVDANDVVVGAHRIPRASIRDAVIVPGPPRVLRLLRRRAADVDLLFSDTSAADELARRLGLDPAHHALRV